MSLCPTCGAQIASETATEQRLAEILDHCERAGLPLMLGEYLALPDVAAVLQVHDSSVRRYLGRADLTAEYIRGRRYVHVFELARFMASGPEL